ncbi:MAG: hypothetical protein ACYC3I_03395 [Gemmataceae bacterium]
MRAGFLMLTLTLLSCPPPGRAADNKPSNRASAQVFGLDKVWSMHLTIPPDQWEKMQPKRGRGGFGFPPNRDAKPAEAKPNAPSAEVKREVPPAEPERDAKPRGMFGGQEQRRQADERGDERGREVSLRQVGQGTQGRAESGGSDRGDQQTPTSSSWIWRPWRVPRRAARWTRWAAARRSSSR